METRIRSCEDLIRLIDTWGFVPFFRNAICGFSVEELTPPELWFSDTADGPWEWKGPAIRQSGCAYGKFFCGKAVFISREWFPEFANWRRDGYDYDARGITREVLIGMGYAFLLSRVAVHIHRWPKYGDVLSVQTWENGAKGAHMQRVFQMKNQYDALCVSARSDWIQYNRNTKNICFFTC